ncbi:hypothetical protein ABL78_7056 [Leptomonas seymouri]|uniref:Uncharacterized protein n=1 Tax=Leptomonas seymouri TaxID=5684 RepID=A0A0N0P3A1_LEPSE|nr:hypothetical protein ABL78_7056 [Leptomonas seymouri]|eukprot:KPI83896.1 hypothetical protein ABL78_7056 [Leptomonas seymouri]
MSYSQPPPLRRPQPATALSDLDVVTSIQQAKARLTASVVARSRGRDSEQQRERSAEPFALAASSAPSPGPRLPQSAPVSTPSQPRPPISPPESVTTAAPSPSVSSSTSRRESVSPPSAYARPPPPASQHRHTMEYVNLSPPDAKSADIRPEPRTAHPQLRAAASEPTATNASGSSAHRSTEEELQYVRQQLEEVQRLYSYEKRAHVQQRARQLRAEAQQRQTEDGIVEQTAQLLADYEELIRFRDVTSAEHLEAAMQRVSQEWQRCAVELEQTRDDCATSLLGRLQASCAEHQETLKKALQKHLVVTAQSTVEAEAQQFQVIATAVQDQVESFKTEYRAIVEQDREERNRLMDAQAVRREQQWLKFLKEEHARMVAVGETAARESSRRQLETLHAAMRDITELRESLVKEHVHRQAEAGRQLVDSYERLAEEYAVAAQETAEYAQHLQQEYAGIIKRLHDEVTRVAAAKHAAEREAQEAEVRAQEVMAEQQHAIEARAEARWQKKLAEEREGHRTALATFALQHENILHEQRASYDSKEEALMAQFAAELSTLREELMQQRDEHHARVDASRDTLKATVRRLEAENVSLSGEVLRLRDQLSAEHSAHEAALQDVRREQENHCATQLRNRDALHEAALQKCKEQVATSAAVASTHALQRVADLEEQMQRIQRQHASELCRAVDEAASLWSSRLKESQKRQTEEQDALEAQHRRLRHALLEEVREREAAVESRCAAQREAHQQELQEAVLLVKEESKLAMERLRHEHEAAWAQREADAAAHAALREEAFAAVESNLSAANAALQRSSAEERDGLLQTLLNRVDAECAEQKRLLHERETRLREECDAFAQQQLQRTQEARMAIQQEERAKHDADLQDARQQWMQLFEEHMHQRYATWQAARKAELDSVHAFHQNEVDLLREYYEEQLQCLRSHHDQHGEDFRQEMRARETAWVATRAASLDAYEKAAEDRLREVLEHEKREWESAQRQRAATAGANLESVAQHVAGILAATEDDRCRTEQELREVYVTVIQDQEVKTAQHLAELHANHEKDLAKLRQEGEERLQRQGEQLREEFRKQSKQQDEHLKRILMSHEEEVAALRAEHLEKIAEQRTAAHEALLHAHQHASEAQRAQETSMEAARREDEQRYRRQLHELQKRCDAQAAQLMQCEADMRTQEQRIREEQEAVLRLEYERSMEDLRAALNARNQSYATLQASMYEKMGAEAARLQADNEQAYRTFTEGQQRRLEGQLASQEAAVVEQQRRQQEQLARLQQQHEVALVDQRRKLRAEYSDACAELRAVFDAQQAEWKQLLDSERAERGAVESTVKSLTFQLSQLRVAQEQQQAAAYRALDQEYRHLLDQAMAQLQEVREEAARRSLEAAEEHFVSELWSLACHQSGEDQLQQQPSMSLTPIPMRPPEASRAPSADMDVSPSHSALHAAHSVVPLLMRRGVATPAASRTPRPLSTPLSASPAGPVELAETPARALPSSASQKAPTAQQRLQQLWGVLGVPLDERQATLDYIHSLQDVPQEQQRALKEELLRLEAQLPLLEALTRRDYVERQLRTLRHAPPLSSITVNKSAGLKHHQQQQDERPSTKQKAEEEDPSRPVSRSASSTAASAQAYDRLAEELEHLTEQLRHDVAAHETRYGQLFCYNGRRVMETLGV